MRWPWRKRTAEAALGAPTSLGPLTTNSTVSAAYLATTPLHYWPLDEASGTTAADLVAIGTLNGTCSGMTMGGTNAPLGIGGKAPLFTGGSEHIVLKAGKILGGLSAWSICGWVKYDVLANDPTLRRFYGESTATTGNNQVGAGISGGSDSSLRLTYGADAVAPADLGTSSIFIDGIWAFVCMTRTGATIEYWYDLGRRTLRTDGGAANTWTDASVVTWLGNMPRTGTPWKGSMAHIAIYDRVLSHADQKSIYEACTPYSRTLINQEVFTNSASIWKQRLDEPSNQPIIAASSAGTVTKLVAQAAQYTAGHNESTGPMFVVSNATPVQRMRISGGHNNIFNPPQDMYDAMGLFRTPTNFGYGGAQFENEASTYNTDTHELFEFFGLQQTLMPGNVFSGPQGVGTVPAGSHTYFVVGANASNQPGRAYWQTTASVNGSQGVALAWTEAEDIDHYAIYRDGLLIATKPVGTTTMVDTGLAAGAAYPGATAVTTDWGCLAAGYLANTTTGPGNWEAPRDGWGVAGSRLPLWGGSVSIKEAQAGVIDHALAIGLPEVDIDTHVYPATRNDGTTYPNRIPEGTRFRLKASADVSALPAFEQMCAAALKKYGGYVRDVTGEVSIYAEQAQWIDPTTQGAYIGRNVWFEILEGRYGYECFDNFPWDQMEVIDPAWTEAQTTALPVADPWETLVETFATPTLDPALWAGVSNVTISSGEAALDVNPSYTGIFKSVATNHYTLVGSHFSMQVIGAPTSVPGSEGALTIFNQGDINSYIEFIYTDDSQLVAGYSTSGLVRTRAHQQAYDPVAHAWWRIRESAGIVYWEVSPDGNRWNSFAQLTWASSGWSAAMLEDMRAQIYAGNFNGLSAGPTFIVAKVNTTPAEIVTATEDSVRLMVVETTDGNTVLRMVTLSELGL